MSSNIASASPPLADSLLMTSNAAADDVAPRVHQSIPQISKGEVTFDSDSSSSPVELMVHTRTRRSNAGNRMSKLIAIEEADDIGRTLYEALEDVPDDDDFGDSEADVDADDLSLVSSTSDGSSSDEPFVAQSEDPMGEKELEKEERSARRALKRKAHDAFLKRPGLLKRARLRDADSQKTISIKGSASKSAELPVIPIEQPRRRKLDRVSWLGTDGSLKGQSRRLSNRASTLKSRAETHQRLLSKERTRLITVATMKAAEERREALKQKPFTQEDRLAEAARTERLNAKSLNRWEEKERKKIAERRAKLEAQRNKGIEGEYIRFWSGSIGGKKGNGHNRGTFPQSTIGSALSIKDSENAQTRASLPLPTNISNGVTETNLPAGIDTYGITEAAGPKSAASIDDKESMSYLRSSLTRDIPPQNLHPSSGSFTKSPTVPIPSSIAVLPMSDTTSQSPNAEKMQAGYDTLENPSFLDGIHFWASQPETSRRVENSATTTYIKPLIQTKSVSSAFVGSSAALTDKIAEFESPQNQKDENETLLNCMVKSPNSQPGISDIVPSSLHPRQSLLSLNSSSLKQQAEQREPSPQRSPYLSSHIIQQSNNEKRTRNLIMLQNIDPSQVQNTTTRDRDRDKDFLRRKLLGWPMASAAGAGIGNLAMSLKSKNSLTVGYLFGCVREGRYILLSQASFCPLAFFLFHIWV